MRFSPIIFIAFVAVVQAQTTPMTAADAFAAGKSSGDQAAVQSAFGSITSAKGAEIIPGYSSSTPPQSSYWSPSALIGPVLSGGVAKIAECDGPASSDPKIKNHCEAVQALAKQPSLRPPNLITSSDPLIVKGDAITNNPESIAGAITGIYSACTTKTVSLGKEKQTETCEDYATTGSANCQLGYEVKVDADHLFKCLDSVKVSANASCTIGRLITVDADANYQCTKAEKKHETYTCNKTAIADVQYVNVGGCTPGTFLGYMQSISDSFGIGTAWAYPNYSIYGITCLGNGNFQAQRYAWNVAVSYSIAGGYGAVNFTTNASNPVATLDSTNLLGETWATTFACNHTTTVQTYTDGYAPVYLMPGSCAGLYNYTYGPYSSNPLTNTWYWNGTQRAMQLAFHLAPNQIANAAHISTRQLTVTWDNQCVALESRAL